MSLLEATTSEVSHPIDGTVETFPKLSYADQAEILRAALKQRRQEEMELLSVVGITGAAALPHLKKLDADFRGDDAFVKYANKNEPRAGAGINDIFGFVLKKKHPEANASQIAATVEAVPWDDKFKVVLLACNLSPITPGEATEGGSESPLTGAGSGNSPSGESGGNLSTG